MMAKVSYYAHILILLIAAVGSWALFSMIYSLTEELMINIGITSEPVQYFIIFLACFIVLVAAGWGVKKSINVFVKS
jgi:hypothetical protein